MKTNILFFILISYSMCLKSTTISKLTINHLEQPIGIDIYDNNFAFETEEEGPFTASIVLNGETVLTREVKLENSHSFSFNESLEYNKIYKYVVESSNSKAELDFETAIKLEAPFIKPKNKDLFSPIFRKEFDLENNQIKKARLYIAGLGLYQAFINDKRVGNSYLTPGYNDYDNYLRYQTYDIAGLLGDKNNLEVHMGDGWYKGRFGIKHKGKEDTIFGDEYKLCAQIIIEFNDGKIQEISTGESWKVKPSYQVANSIYDGEEVDYTKSIGPEEEVIKTATNDTYNLVPDFGSAMVQKDLLIPELYISPKGEKILDFKQNMVGFVRYKGSLNNGQELIIKHGEVLQDKCFYNANYRSAKSLLRYVGDGKSRVYEPKFTFMGFRYVLIEGLDNVNPQDFEGVVIYTDLEKTIECETGSKKINQLIKNAYWGQRGNFLDVPTDCPQRDERLGWTGDSQVFSNTACYNMNSYNFYKKFIKDLRGDQIMYLSGDIPSVSPCLKGEFEGGGAVWADAGTIIPWNLYMNYGDKLLLKNSYQMMKDYVDTLIKRDEDQGNKHLILQGFTYGDWLALDGFTEQKTLGGTDNGFILSVYYYVSVSNLVKAAKELELTDDVEKYEELQKKIYQAILDEFYSPNGRLTVHTQTAYILSLYYKIYKDVEVIKKGYRERLNRDLYKLKTGFTGTPLLMLSLFDNGLDADAYRFLYNQKYPGWLYAVNLGATTIWERWNSLLEDGTISGTSMNSLNHYSYGSVCEAIYSRIAGLKNLSPGWKKVLIQPHLNYRMGKMNLAYHSISGTYKISWIFNEGKFDMNVTIPNGAEAQIVLPNGETYNVGKGDYHYECTTDNKALSIDIPLFEIIENKDGASVLNKTTPSIYNAAVSGDIEVLYCTIRQLIGNYFHGVSQEEADKCQEELVKVKIPPIEDGGDDPTDEPTASPTDQKTDPSLKSSLLTLSIFLFGLIILF